MSVPTSSEILDAAAVAAAEGVESAAGDGQSATQMDPLKQIAAADKLATREALAGLNPQGGARSLWNGTRPARVIPPGAV